MLRHRAGGYSNGAKLKVVCLRSSRFGFEFCLRLDSQSLIEVAYGNHRLHDGVLGATDVVTDMVGHSCSLLVVLSPVVVENGPIFAVFDSFASLLDVTDAVFAVTGAAFDLVDAVLDPSSDVFVQANIVFGLIYSVSGMAGAVFGLANAVFEWVCSEFSLVFAVFCLV